MVTHDRTLRGEQRGQETLGWRDQCGGDSSVGESEARTLRGSPSPLSISRRADVISRKRFLEVLTTSSVWRHWSHWNAEEVTLRLATTGKGDEALLFDSSPLTKLFNGVTRNIQPKLSSLYPSPVRWKTSPSPVRRGQPF